MATTRELEFKTYDGFKLRATLYPAGEKRPCVIMTCGFGGERKHFLPDFAGRFQAAGIAALVYDNRGWGDSEGGVRGEVDPFLQSRDYHDAYNFATSLPEVDATKIVYWGTSMSGGTALFAAALNKKIAAVVVQVPFISGEWVGLTAPQDPSNLIPERAHAIATGAPTMIPALPETREEVENGTSKAVLKDPASLPFMDEMRRRGWTWGKTATLQSLANCAMFEPLAYIHRIAPTPLLMIVAGSDTTTPTHLQLEGFARAREPKTVRILKEETHFSLYFGEPFEKNVKAQIDFLKETLGV